MALDQSMIDQLSSIFSALKHQYILRVTAPDNEKGKELSALVTAFVSSSDKLTAEINAGDNLLLELLKDGNPTGVSFRAIPTGHEFTSLILAVYNADGKGKNYPDEVLLRRIQSLKKPIKLTTYASLTCTNCPEVVQSLNLIALIAGEGVTHEMVLFILMK